MMIITAIAFLLHATLALFASLNFLKLSSQTPDTTLIPSTNLTIRPVIRSYALLLLSTSIVSFVLGSQVLADAFSLRVTRWIALGMGVYHVGPILRAWERVKNGNEGKELGGPVVHLITHLLVEGLLVFGMMGY